MEIPLSLMAKPPKLMSIKIFIIKPEYIDLCCEVCFVVIFFINVMKEAYVTCELPPN